MDGFMIALSLSTLFIWCLLLYSRGYLERAHKFNPELGRSIAAGHRLDTSEVHLNVIIKCLLLSPFGGLFYLLGWLVAKNENVDLYRRIEAGRLKPNSTEKVHFEQSGPFPLSQP